MATQATTQNNESHLASLAGKVWLTPSTTGVYHVPKITPESAKAASDLLQENHIRNHVFFNQSGFHNHITHHLLTIFALGAAPGQLQKGFTENQGYQRAQYAIKNDIVEQMGSSREKLASFFGKEKHFRDFEEFFEREITAKGIKHTLDEWVFKGDEVAEGMFTRLFAGFYHPIIHFGFGLEFQQPAILTEGLAQAAVHDNWVAPYLLGAEKAAASSDPPSPRKSLIQLLHEARANDTIRNSPHPSDGNKTRDGVIGRAAKPMIEVARQWTVEPTPADLKFKTAEMIQTAFYFTAAAQRPTKIPKFDFFYMHCTNASIFFSAFLARQDMLGADAPALKNQARMLEMKARTDLAMYISRASPALDVQRIKDYQPKHPEQGWAQIFERACAYADDGHASKLIRATANAEQVCKEFEKEQDWPIHGDMWLKIGHMAIDSVEADGPRWVRDVGRDSAWDEVPDRTDAKL